MPFPDTAWGYIRWFQGDPGHLHEAKLHCGAVSSPSAPYPWTTPGATAGVQNFMDILIAATAKLFTNSYIAGDFQVFKNNFDGTFSFFAEGTPATPTVFGGGAVLESTEITFNLVDSMGKIAKYVALEVSNSVWSPAKLAGALLTASPWVGVDNVINGDVNIVSKHGNPLHTTRSVTQTLNRRLRRHEHIA